MSVLDLSGCCCCRSRSGGFYGPWITALSGDISMPSSEQIEFTWEIVLANVNFRVLPYLHPPYIKLILITKWICVLIWINYNYDAAYPLSVQAKDNPPRRVSARHTIRIAWYQMKFTKYFSMEIVAITWYRCVIKCNLLFVCNFVIFFVCACKNRNLQKWPCGSKAVSRKLACAMLQWKAFEKCTGKSVRVNDEF